MESVQSLLQHAWGEVGSVVWVLWQISYTFRQCKTFENRLRSDRVADGLKVGTFLRHCVVLMLQAPCVTVTAGLSLFRVASLTFWPAIYSAPVRGMDYCDQPVCLCVCLSVREHISGTAGPILTKFCARISHGRGSVLLRRRCATLCTSGFTDDVTLGRSGPYERARKYSAPGGVARPRRSLMSMNAGWREQIGYSKCVGATC